MSPTRKRKSTGSSHALVEFPSQKRSRTENPNKTSLVDMCGASLLEFQAPHQAGLLALDIIGASDESAAQRGILSQNLMALGGMDKFISVWNLDSDDEQDTERNCWTLRSHKNAVTSLRFLPDALHLVSASADHTCILWDLHKMAAARRFRAHESVVNELSICHKSESVDFCSVSDDQKLMLWDSRKKEPVHVLSFNSPLLTVDCSNPMHPLNRSGYSSTHIACASLDNSIRIFDIRNLAQPHAHIPDAHSDSITCLRYSPDQCTLASFSMDQCVKLFDVRSFSSTKNAPKKKLYGPTHDPSTAENNLIRLSWSEAEPQLLACGSADGAVYLFDSFSGKLVKKFAGHQAAVNEVKFHPRGRILCSVSDDKRAIIGDL